MSQLGRLINTQPGLVLALWRLFSKHKIRSCRLVISNIMPVFAISCFTTGLVCLNRHLHGKLSLLTEPFACPRHSGEPGHQCWQKFFQHKRHHLVPAKNTALQRSGDVVLLLPYLHLQPADQQQQLNSAAPPLLFYHQSITKTEF